MSKGKFAGNVDTNGGWEAGTAGIDCSGFVGVVWKLTDYKRNTEGLRSLSTQIDITAVKKMDAGYWPYRHILLFAEPYQAGKDTYYTYESTTDGDDKVKMFTRSRRDLEVKGYQWIKYNNMLD